MHFLITGHTGFKGSWLSLMLHMQGHTVSGLSLDPLRYSLFNQADLMKIFKNDLRIDIRDISTVKREIKHIEPDVIIHLAAQPLVRESYRIPVETFEINVIGTLNVLESTKGLKNLKTAVIVTTDKVYKNFNHLRGYVETDALGGDDPYSASKAAADIATQSWIKNFASIPIAIARSGNVIGGGDWAQDRLIPDLVTAYSSGRIPTLRYPSAIRPWQHVLDCLNGYLSLVKKQIYSGPGGEWNFGPDLVEKHTVKELVIAFAREWGVEDRTWRPDTLNQPHEAGNLLLNSDKARSELKWRDKLDFATSVKWTADWFKSRNESEPRLLCEEQIKKFMSL